MVTIAIRTFMLLGLKWCKDTLKGKKEKFRKSNKKE